MLTSGWTTRNYTLFTPPDSTIHGWPVPHKKPELTKKKPGKSSEFLIQLPVSSPSQLLLTSELDTDTTSPSLTPKLKTNFVTLTWNHSWNHLLKEKEVLTFWKLLKEEFMEEDTSLTPPSISDSKLTPSIFHTEESTEPPSSDHSDMKLELTIGLSDVH